MRHRGGSSGLQVHDEHLLRVEGGGDGEGKGEAGGLSKEWLVLSLLS